MSSTLSGTKITIGFRVDPLLADEVDRVCGQLGINRTDWMNSLIREALGHQPVETMGGLMRRVAALESKLAGLAS